MLRPYCLAFALLGALSCHSPTDQPVRERATDEQGSTPRVLILGDSISIGYTPFVTAILDGEAVVMRPPGNCQGTTHGVANVERWLQLDGGDFAVIYFNFGLHDIKHVDPATRRNSNNSGDPRQAAPAIYESQMRQIVADLRATGAALVFATTTPVPAGGVRPYRDVADVERYNAIARRVMADNDVAVHDLYAFALARLAEIQRPVNVHFTPKGSEMLGGEVARTIRTRLGR